MVGVEVTKRGWIVFTFLKAEQWFFGTVSEGYEGKRGAHELSAKLGMPGLRKNKTAI